MWYDCGSNRGNFWRGFAAAMAFSCSEAAFSQMQDGIIVMDETLENRSAWEQRERAVKEQDDQQGYTILNHAFFENERVKIYNYTAYAMGLAQNKFLLGQTEQIGLQDFGISFGFGFRLRVNSRQNIGYEYLSNFPYDRGQIIRLYWNSKF